MQKVLVGLTSSLALVGIGFGVWAAKLPTVDREVQVVGGRTTIAFYASTIESNGLRLKTQPTAEPDDNTAEESVGFEINPVDLGILLNDGSLVRYEQGAIGHTGGFTLSNGKDTIDARGFLLSPVQSTTQTLEVLAHKGRAVVQAFDLVSPRISFDFDTQTLAIAQMDLQISTEGAQALGRPDLVGLLVGTMTVYAETKPTDGGGRVSPPAGDKGNTILPVSTTYDVAISHLEAIAVLGRLGAFPNGRNGLSMRTTSCNVGNENIPWRAPMQVEHPVIAMNLYRIKDGKFEQIGWSWLKHGFFATNQDDCGVCNDQGGSFLGLDCSDTYGTGNNGDRFYLGERKEVNPYTGVWTCTGSYFSNYQADCVRRRPTSGEFIGDPVSHRLEVLDADLNVTGATFYFEAFYINTNETVDVYNNVSNRRASFSWSGSAWLPSTLEAAQTLGPAINRWGDMRGTASVAGDGDVIVAVDVTDNGNGTWHYEYAVYNHNSDRAVREFSVPVPVGANVTNIEFRDVDQDVTNQWAPTVTGGALTWATGTEGSSTANPLRYSSVFNFRFDANVQPASSTASMGLFKSGGAMTMGAPTMGPLVLQPVAGYTHRFSITTSGNLLSLKDSDDDRLMLKPGLLLSSNSFFGIETTTTAPVGAVSSIIVGVESRDASADGSGGVRKIDMYNWTSGLWELVDTRPTTNADSKYLVTITTNASRFVNASTREVLARFQHRGGLTISSARPFGFDQVGFKFN